MSSSYLIVNEVKGGFFKSHKTISLNGDGYIYDLVIDDEYIMSLIPNSEIQKLTNLTLNLYNIECKNLTIDIRSKRIKSLTLCIIDTNARKLDVNNKHGSLEIAYLRTQVSCVNVKSMQLISMQLISSRFLEYKNIGNNLNISITESSAICSLSFSIVDRLVIDKSSSVLNLRGYVKSGSGTAETALQSKYGIKTEIKRTDNVYHDIEYFNDKALSYVISHMV